MKLFAPFNVTKFDDEQRIVTGYASTEALDSQGEIVKREAMERALPDWMKFGNIREMHTASAVGVAVSAKYDDNGLLLEAKIIDPVAWEKVKAGVYKGFSIGGRVTNRDKVQRHVITGMHLTEISIVDRPANPEALFDVWKDGVTHKGMCGVGQLADILAQIQSLAQDADWEAQMEADGSTIPQAIKDWLKSGGQLLTAMTEEEISEMTENDNTPDILALVTAVGDCAKRGKLTGANKDSAQAIHDHSCAMGATCDDSAKAATADDLAKAIADAIDLRKQFDDAIAEHATQLTSLTGERDDLAKSVSDLTAERDTIAAELAALKASPAPMKGAVLTLSKTEDAKPATPETQKAAPAAQVTKPGGWFKNTA